MLLPVHIVEDGSSRNICSVDTSYTPLSLYDYTAVSTTGSVVMSGFNRSGRHCLHQARSAVSCPTIWRHRQRAEIVDPDGTHPVTTDLDALSAAAEFQFGDSVYERNKAALLLSLSKQHMWVPTSTDLIGKPIQGYKMSRPLTLTVARRVSSILLRTACEADLHKDDSFNELI